MHRSAKQRRYFWAQSSVNFNVDKVAAVQLHEVTCDMVVEDGDALLSQIHCGNTLSMHETYYSESGDSIIPMPKKYLSDPRYTHRNIDLVDEEFSQYFVDVKKAAEQQNRVWAKVMGGNYE